MVIAVEKNICQAICNQIEAYIALQVKCISCLDLYKITAVLDFFKHKALYNMLPHTLR